jgi:hypothetical protein
MKNFNQYIVEKIKLSNDRFDFTNITYDKLAEADWTDMPQYTIDGSIDRKQKFEIHFGQISLYNNIIGAWSHVFVNNQYTSFFSLIIPQKSINNFISKEELNKKRNHDESTMPDELIELIDDIGVFIYDRDTIYSIEEDINIWKNTMTDWAAIAEQDEKFDEFYNNVIKQIENRK